MPALMPVSAGLTLDKRGAGFDSVLENPSPKTKPRPTVKIVSQDTEGMEDLGHQTAQPLLFRRRLHLIFPLREITMEIISRKEALEHGLKRYFTGKPCSHEHIAERGVSNRACITCEKARHTTTLKREAVRERKKAWRKTNPQKHRDSERRRRAKSAAPLVYIVGAGRGMHKVGLTNLLYHRISQLQVGSPVPLKLVHTIPLASQQMVEELEACLHRELKPCHSHGEWFRIPRHKLLRMADRCAKEFAAPQLALAA
jgi:hypothetical protein